MTVTLIWRSPIVPEVQYFTTDFPLILKFNPALIHYVWLMLTLLYISAESLFEISDWTLS